MPHTADPCQNNVITISIPASSVPIHQSVGDCSLPRWPIAIGDNNGLSGSQQSLLH